MTSWTIVVDNSKVVDNTMVKDDTFVVDDTYVVDNIILMGNTIVDDDSKGDGQYHVSSFSFMIVSPFLHLFFTNAETFPVSHCFTLFQYKRAVQGCVSAVACFGRDGQLVVSAMTVKQAMLLKAF